MEQWDITVKALGDGNIEVVYEGHPTRLGKEGLKGYLSMLKTAAEAEGAELSIKYSSRIAKRYRL